MGRYPEPKAPKMKLGTWASSGLVLTRGLRLGHQSSASSTGGSQKKRKAAIRKESASTQQHESCQQNDMEVDMEENKEERSFVPSSVSNSAGGHDPMFMCAR